MQESLLSEWSSPIWPRSATGGRTTACELPTSERLTAGTDGSALPDFLLPTPNAQESTPTDEFLDEFRENLDPDDPLHRLWLPGRKWMTQRTLSRTVPALLPTPGANDANGAEKETRERRQEEGATGGPSLRDLPRLLPTPTTQDGENTAGPSQRDRNSAPLNLVAADAADGKLLPTPTAGDAKASGSRNLEGSKAHPGVSLTDAIQTGDSTTPRLLPTPQAADGDGGRQEKGAMGRDGKRPSGHKATLPLPTAVELRETISETPFTAEVEAGEQIVLLPTPRVTSERSGRGAMVDNQQWSSVALGQAVEIARGELPREFNSWDEVPGELGRLAREMLERETDDPALLPTPVANPDNPGAGGELRAAVVHGEGRRNETGTDTLGRPNTGRPSRLLPTPTAAAGDNASEQGPRHYIEGSDNPTLLGAARRASGELRHSEDPHLLPTPTPGDVREPSDKPAPGPAVLKDAAPQIAWGVYEAAIRRWERILGREAPTPTDEKGRLAPAFVEWMLGYPAGWISGIDIPRTAQLRILGNSVQVDCGERVGEWLGRLAFAGVI